jgi:hypothetical protein
VLCRDLPAVIVAPAFGVLDAWMVAAMVVGSVAAPVAMVAVGVRVSLVIVAVGVALVGAAALRTRSAVRHADLQRPASVAVPGG